MSAVGGMTEASQCYIFFRTDITVRGLLCSFSILGSLTWMAKTPYLKFPGHTQLRLLCSYFLVVGLLDFFWLPLVVFEASFVV